MSSTSNTQQVVKFAKGKTVECWSHTWPFVPLWSNSSMIVMIIICFLLKIALSEFYTKLKPRQNILDIEHTGFDLFDFKTKSTNIVNSGWKYMYKGHKVKNLSCKASVYTTITLFLIIKVLQYKNTEIAFYLDLNFTFHTLLFYQKVQ